MRYVDRSLVDEPASLADEDSDGARESGRAAAHYAQVPEPEKSYSFKAYKNDDVKDALRALFHGKCAYCEIRYEGSQPVDVEHYRPKGGIEEFPGHRGYWWLAASWTNLLPSCTDCNRRRRQVSAEYGMSLDELEVAHANLDNAEPGGKQNAFPTFDDVWAEPNEDPEQLEKPLLIDPTRTDPSQFFVWPKAEISVVLASQQGMQSDYPCAETSIDIYALNRIGLVQSRLEMRQDLDLHLQLLRMTAEDAMVADGEQRAQLITRLTEHILALRKRYEDPKHAFSTMLSAHLDEFENELTQLLY
ncbi:MULTISPECIES: hypothetical protein [unclassified Mameliella]|uniref:hypothetical protein n=1 Tax=unclassified Mameliella TaxID=2630630 RepID=UPI00273DC94F|nr:MULTISPECIES: hypothetical protein [unclassified Mameliella]